MGYPYDPELGFREAAPIMPALTGPSRPPASGGRPNRLVILLHGLGADGNDLIGLAPYWRDCCQQPNSCRRMRPSPAIWHPTATNGSVRKIAAPLPYWPACAR